MYREMLKNMRSLTPEEQEGVNKAIHKMSTPTGANIMDKFEKGDAYVKLTKGQRNFLLSLFASLYKEPNETVEEIKKAIQIANSRVED